MDSRAPAHNKGFRLYDTAHDLEERFANEDRQGELFPLAIYEQKEDDWMAQCGNSCSRF